MTFDHNVVYRNPVWSLVLIRPGDLAENARTANLVMPARPAGGPTATWVASRREP